MLVCFFNLTFLALPFSSIECLSFPAADVQAAATPYSLLPTVSSTGYGTARTQSCRIWASSVKAWPGLLLGILCFLTV